MKKVFISKNYPDKYTASSKAKLDAEQILSKNGYTNIGLSAKCIQNRLLGRIYTVLSNVKGYLSMPKNGVLFLQYPTNLCEKQIARAHEKGCKVIILIHDLNCLRDVSLDTVEPLKMADLVIAHTASMKKWLLDNNINKNIEVLKIFDYLDSTLSKEPDKDGYKIAFAGNLGKSDFLSQLKGNDLVSFRLFGIGIENQSLNEGLEYCGCFSPDKLAVNLKSHFGLVWDGESIDECSGITGKYLRYISPHKLSMYLSAGLPVIVWKESAMSEFVKNNNIGIAVESLKDINTLLSNLSEEDYKRMKDNAENIGQKLANGEYLSDILKNFH
ncbi:MAG: hypothetical protein HDT28_07710 [Clostridiales bacterium]|nr:hypothetical protein [Clostridiales bacterium]